MADAHNRAWKYIKENYSCSGIEA